MRLRTAQRADLAAIRELEGNAEFRFEDPATGVSAGLETEIIEHIGRIVAVSRYRFANISVPPNTHEPLAVLADFIVDGDHRALLGEGLVLDPELEGALRSRAHRLLRTLRADEAGARFTICRAPLPKHPDLEPSGVAQQIAAGALAWPPVTKLLDDGYWPSALADERSVWLVHEATWL